MRIRGVRLIYTQLVSLSALAAVMAVVAVGQSPAGLSAATSAPGSSGQGTVAEPATGITATGTATIAGPRGEESGSITVAAWGENYCKVTITLSPAQSGRSYAATLNGGRMVVNAPSGLAPSAPLPVGPALGCALLPEALAYDRLAAAGGTISTDASGRPLSLTWSVHGQTAVLTYGDYGASVGASHAATLTVTVAGQARLTIHLDSIASQSFTNADFAFAPPLHAPPATHGYPGSSGGGQ